MKKNFLVTTGLIDTWEFEENNFLLGKWCEFPKLNDHESKKFIIKKKTSNIFLSPHHWDNADKRIKDYDYLKKVLENLVIILSEKLSALHNTQEGPEYWRPIIYGWLNQYVMTLFDRWETVKNFFYTNNNKEFYSYFIEFKYLDYIPNDHLNFNRNTQEDDWNHFIFLRILNFLKIKNLKLLEKKKINNFNKRRLDLNQKLSAKSYIINFFDILINKFAFNFNNIIFESFRFPKKQFIKLCIRRRLIPSIYSSIFNFKLKNNIIDVQKRNKFQKLLADVGTNDEFIKFLLLNLHQDIPKCYLENFNEIKKKVLPFANKKKIIFSMHSLTFNDIFKIYISETLKVGSKLIYVNHGGGLTSKMEPYYDFIDKVAYRQIVLDDVVKKNFVVKLSPTWPINSLNLQKNKKKEDCNILFVEPPNYIIKFITGPTFNQTVEFFDELTNFVKQLNPEIKSRVKLRAKLNGNFQSEKKFTEIFGENSIDKMSLKNPFSKTISRSKLIIATYPHTAFSEAMSANIPTLLILKKNHWQFTDSALNMIELFKKNEIAFDEFDKARLHINQHWNDIDVWWKSENVQLARQKYLKNFFDVKENIYKEWSDYIYSLSSPN